MTALVVMLVLISAGAGLLLVQLCRMLSAPRNLEQNLDDLSTDRYLPMVRLLDGSDQEFLSSQPGFTPKMAARLRKERCQTFRGYLRCLQSDFQQACWAIKVLLMQSATDRPDLAALVLRSQVAFAYGVLAVQLRVTLYGRGIGTVRIGDLLERFNGIQLELRSLTPLAMPNAA